MNTDWALPVHMGCDFGRERSTRGSPVAAIEADWRFQVNDSSSHLSQKGYRSILSGVGGDEVLGGVPSPLPELADFLLSGRFYRLLRASVACCLIDRSPLIPMLANVAKFRAGIYFGPDLDDADIPPWITSNHRKHCIERRSFLRASETHLGVSPSAISNSLTWSSVLESLPRLNHSALARYECRYPYLDRDLVEFLFSIPRGRLVRPGRRRSLMRRALRSIVPAEILERRRKAYVIRGPRLLYSVRK